MPACYETIACEIHFNFVTYDTDVPVVDLSGYKNIPDLAAKALFPKASDRLEIGCPGSQWGIPQDCNTMAHVKCLKLTIAKPGYPFEMTVDWLSLTKPELPHAA